MVGQSQSPVGKRATTSTLPYRMFIAFRVVRRADMTGLITVSKDELDVATHCETLVDVQVPSAVRLRVYPFSMSAALMTSEVRVGTR